MYLLRSKSNKKFEFEEQYDIPGRRHEYYNYYFNVRLSGNILAYVKSRHDCMKDNNSSRENYTRVTSMLYPFSGLEKIDPSIVMRAAERGTKVHKICEGIAQGLGEIGVDEETFGYVESFKKWWSQGVNPVMIEERFWCDELQITGQVDFIVKNEEGSLSIVDLKTSSRPSKTWQIQGCAYAYLAKKAKHDIQKIQFIHLNKHGKEPKIYEYPVDDSFFFALYRIFQHFYKA